ncbi:hypothetical protein EIP91_006334 [Steccherinum ochraceum]|uniref:Uncharacterized protein n=1 Tax=Steccherinum ochraceum TaxID=92696 RepID=A0A4R0R8M3_9APHY|nr:hypothetical protein EIP91_006334 [Steccherinum ochraceum]
MSDLHPNTVFSQTDKQLNELLAHSTELSDEEIAEALRILKAQLSNQANTQAINREINSLAKQTLSTEGTFDKVTALLAKIGNEADKGSMKKDLEALATTWKELSRSYKQFLWDSREVAGKAEAAARDFASDFVEFLKDSHVDKRDKKSEIKNYLGQLDRDSAKSKNLKRGLVELQGKLRTFSKDWKAFIDKYDAGHASNEWAQLDSDVKRLTIHLATLRAKIVRLSKSLGVITSTTGVSSILAAICPEIWTDIMVATLQRRQQPSNALSEAVSEAENIQCQLDQKTSQRDAVTERLSSTKALHAHVHSEDAGITEVCNKLAAIFSVWDTIREDLNIISGLLDHTNTGLALQMFELRLDTVASLYKTLAGALRQYQTQISL